MSQPSEIGVKDAHLTLRLLSIAHERFSDEDGKMLLDYFERLSYIGINHTPNDPTALTLLVGRRELVEKIKSMVLEYEQVKAGKIKFTEDEDADSGE